MDDEPVKRHKRGRQRDDGDDESSNNPPESKRTKQQGDENERRAIEDMPKYFERAVETGRSYVKLANPDNQLRFPILPTAYNGLGIGTLETVGLSQSGSSTPTPLQMDALLGLAGLQNAYVLSKDRFEEYKYRFPEFHRAYIFDAQAAAWVYYFNRAFKAHQDYYRHDVENRDYFEYPCPPHYIHRSDEWMKRVEDLLKHHGSLATAFPGYGMQAWPSSQVMRGVNIEARYYGSISEFKEMENDRSIMSFFKGPKIKPRIFKRKKAAERKIPGMLVWLAE